MSTDRRDTTPILALGRTRPTEPAEQWRPGQRRVMVSGHSYPTPHGRVTITCTLESGR